MHLTEDRLEQCGLSGTVGSDDADELALIGHERAAVEDVHPRQVAGDDVVDVHDRRLGLRRGGHGLSPSSSVCASALSSSAATAADAAASVPSAASSGA